VSTLISDDDEKDVEFHEKLWPEFQERIKTREEGQSDPFLIAETDSETETDCSNEENDDILDIDGRFNAEVQTTHNINISSISVNFKFLIIGGI